MSTARILILGLHSGLTSRLPPPMTPSPARAAASLMNTPPLDT